MTPDDRVVADIERETRSVSQPAAGPVTVPRERPVGRRRAVGDWVRTALGSVGLRRRPKQKGAIPAPGDRGTQLAAERTQAALERTFMAAERTLMAWVRTSLSMISFGFTLVKVLEAFQKSQQVNLTGPLGRGYSPATLGLALITLGTVALVAAVAQHRVALGRLRARGLQPRWSLALTVASLMALLGVFAFGGIALSF